MVDWIRDSDDDGEKLEWDSDTDGVAAAPASDAPPSSSVPVTVRQGANGKGNGAVPSAALLGHFVAMGFTEEMVVKAIKDNGDGDTEAILELLLTYQAIGGDPSVDNCSAAGRITYSDEDDDNDMENWDDNNSGGNSNGDPDSDDSEDEDFLEEMSQKDKKLKSLAEMGFPEDEAKLAIARCGQDASVSVLADSIYAAQTAGENGCSGNLSDDEDMGGYGYNSFGKKKKRKFLEENKKKRKRYGGAAHESRGPLNGNHDEPMPLPNPMVGFNLPSDRLQSVSRRLPDQAIGPPFFYYENVALAPKGVWTTISRFLYDIGPEFVDSKFFCASARKRGYIHNLPIENRSPLLPLPPKTIYEAFPGTKKWWPSWDPRRQFNCLQTCVASAKLTERIRCALANSDDPPSPRVQKYVLDECRKWNLVWVGLHKVAPLEPDEMEFLLGYPRNHTRGVSRTERYKSLGNSFQVDTVAYHLSVLRDMFPNGMNVLSLFSGIGGAEVALHRLGIRMKTVVSVEVSEVNRNILCSWWEQTNQTGTLIEIRDVQHVTIERLESLIRRYGGFDLVIGGSPCNNLAGSNRHHRDGLEGEQSALFYHYFRILDVVKSIMGRT